MPRETPRARSAARKLIEKVDRTLNALQELKQARAQLSLEASQPPPPLKVVKLQAEAPGSEK
jgi:hypothetical protein